MAVRLTRCPSVGSSRLRFRELTDGRISFPSRGNGGTYEGPLFTDRFQLDKARNDSFIGGDGKLEAEDKDGNGGFGSKLGEM